MSIEKLKLRLQQKLNHDSTQGLAHTKLAKPQRLIKTLYVIEQKFDNLEYSLPVDEKIFKTIAKLESSGFDVFTRKDWKNLAWALSKVFPNTQEKVIFSEMGKKIIRYFQQAENSLIALVYFPLLYSYFALESNDVKAKPEMWLNLRTILSVHRSQVYRDVKHPKKWMNTLVDYPEILSDLPTQVFVDRFLKDQDSNGIQQDLESLRIAPNSWFWDDLIHSSIQSIKKMSEVEFFQLIPRFLTLSETNTLYSTQILVALLERYVQSTQRNVVHEALKHLALNQWGNPQYDSSAGWNNVTPETKRMVVQWFIRADLEAFFTLFSATADINRFDYWIKFIDQISFSQIFLGPSAIQSQQIQHKKFRELNKGRLKELVGSTISNNAFLLKIGNIYVVDFSDKGNACYAYNKLPYRDISPRIHIGELKNKDIVLFRDRWNRQIALSHSGEWESRFDEKLAEIGIFSHARKDNLNFSGYKRSY